MGMMHKQESFKTKLSILQYCKDDAMQMVAVIICFNVPSPVSKPETIS
jgi:hypothetical protein